MTDARYSRSTDHGGTLAAALHDFHRALTRRWREQVCRAVLAGDHDFPRAFQRPMSRFEHEPLWEYWSTPARLHLTSIDGCAYVAWVENGQPGPISGVHCDGATDVAGDGVTVPDLTTGELVPVPRFIECGMGSILVRVEEWAWAERDHVFHKVPLFDHHDLDMLENAYDRLVAIATALGLTVDDDPGKTGILNPTTGRQIPEAVNDIDPESGKGQDWWEGWTGLAAHRGKENFFKSVMPTLENQSVLAASLANRYAERAAIIEKGRNDALYWIQWATGSLDETELVSTDRTGGWKAVQGIGNGTTVIGAISGGTLSAVGATLTLVGFIGEQLLSDTTAEEYIHGVPDVIERLHQEVDTLNSDLDTLEQEYETAVRRLWQAVEGAPGHHLELYDLTRNEPTGDASPAEKRDGSFQVEIKDVLAIAQRSYDAGKGYQLLLPVVAGTGVADPHLADEAGQQTPGDAALLALRDLFDQLLRTTCGRYLLAGDQIREAAEAYVETDLSLWDWFERQMARWKDNEIGEYGSDFDPAEHAQPTDISGLDPYQGQPAPAGSAPEEGES